MYWRGWVPDAPVKAARNGNAVIMTPGNPLYFDNLPDSARWMPYITSTPYRKDSTKNRQQILSARKPIPGPSIFPAKHVQTYMMFPRMTALSECLDNKQDYDGYRARLIPHYTRMDQLRIDYRLPDLEGMVQNNVFTDKAVLAVTPPLPDLPLRSTPQWQLTRC